MPRLRLAITCRCGRRERVQLGQVWCCPDCGRAWDTGQVPAEEYQAYRRAVRRVQVLSLSGVVVAVAVTAPLALLVSPGLLPVGMVLLGVWYFWYLPSHRKQVRKLYATLPRWEIGQTAPDSSKPLPSKPVPVRERRR